MQDTPIAMIQKFIQRWFCDRFAPLLTAYVEGGLKEKEQTKVAAHLKNCAACRQEVEELTELGKLLRAHPPAVPQLRADLWSRIQAEITAESAAQPELPVARPIPRRQPTPNFQWSSFGVSFATTGTLVAAAVVGVVVLTRPLLHSPLDSELPIKNSATTLAVTTVDRGPITLEIRSPSKPGPEPKAKTAAVSTAHVATTEVRPVQPARAPQVALVRRRDRGSNRSVTVAMARAPRSIAAPVKPFYAVGPADKLESDKTLVVEPTSTTPAAATPIIIAKAAEKPHIVEVAMAEPEPRDTSLSDEVVAPREVPAAGFVNDAAKIRARQILFVYSGR
jgi:hypothetical protein